MYLIDDWWDILLLFVISVIFVIGAIHFDNYISPPTELTVSKHLFQEH